MATYDYSALPMNITITNTTPVAMAEDAGTRKVFEVIPVADLIEGEDFVPVSFNTEGALEYVQVTRKYKTTDKSVQFYLTNVTKTLHAGESMTVVARTSAAAAHYMSYAELTGMTATTGTTPAETPAAPTPTEEPVDPSMDPDCVE